MLDQLTRSEGTTPSNAIIIGVDTHEQAQVAVAVTRQGARVSACQVSADQQGYAELVARARSLDPVEAFAVEGTGS